MASAVLDSSVLLAAINEERGAESLGGVIFDSMMSSVNLAEVVAKLIARGATTEKYTTILAEVDLQIVDFTKGMAETSGHLVPKTRHRGLSLGDRACIALAISKGLPAFTADKNWAGLDVGCEIRLIR
jgi:ribonuclease VapC